MPDTVFVIISIFLEFLLLFPPPLSLSDNLYYMLLLYSIYIHTETHTRVNIHMYACVIYIPPLYTAYILNTPAKCLYFQRLVKGLDSLVFVGLNDESIASS